jgi:uncharacterized membrane protein required for colicin V production
MSTTFNVLDLIFIVLTIIFILTAFFRGFVKEIFALFNWIIAFTVSYFLTPYLTEFCAKYFDNKFGLDVSVRSILFVTAFFITAISTSGLSNSMKDKMPKAFDRSLGVLYGFIKTLLIFGFVYALYFNVYQMILGDKLKDNVLKVPSWLEEAKCYSLVRISGETLNPLVKGSFDAVSKNFDQVLPKHILDQKDVQDELDTKINEVIEEKTFDSFNKRLQKESVKENPKKVDSLKVQKPDLSSSSKELQNSGYSKKDIEKMNHLIEIIDKK